MSTALDERHSTPLAPYGLLLQAGADTDVTALEPALLERLALEHRIVVLRGFGALDKAGFEAFGRRFGVLLEWNFGFVLELVVHDAPSNYLFTRGNVPYHWDGAFAEVVPRHQLFQCVEAPKAGSGETTFCDTVRVVERTAPAERAAWERIAIEYRTDKQAHYGGQIRRPLLQPHPLTGATTIRFAEPLNGESVQLNPLFLEIFEDGVALGEQRAREFLASFVPRLYEPAVFYAHPWRSGDFVLTDNHALLHGRRPFFASPRRHIQRLHVI